ncbi:glycosyltransferase family 2 protein [Roseomonas haemaphysalidis]|nr:glycosyltransferase [Roseomonas haemaphysalidis]
MDGSLKQVSVVCPVYNTDPDMIRAAARSVLDQQGASVLELLLVNDQSSSPPTLDVLKALEAEDTRVRVLHNDRNLGPAGTRNAGIRAARGNLIGFLDADDMWRPDSLAARLSAPATEADMVVGSFEDLLPGDVVNTPFPLPLDNGEALGDGWFAWPAPAATHGLINQWRHLGCILAPKAAIKEVGGFDEKLRYGEDWMLIVRLSTLCRVIASNRVLYTLRRQHSSMMTSRARLTRAFSRAEETALVHPALRPYRKQLRWALIRQYKGMAANNLANGMRWQGVQFAVRAWLRDPREIRPLMQFVRAARIANPEHRMREVRKYSTAVVATDLD